MKRSRAPITGSVPELKGEQARFSVRGRGWSIEIVGGSLRLRSGGRARVFGPAGGTSPRVGRRWLVLRYLFDGSEPVVRLAGLRGRESKDLRHALSAFAWLSEVDQAVRWEQPIRHATDPTTGDQWITSEQLRAWESGRPRRDLGEDLGLGAQILLTAEEQRAVALTAIDLRALVTDANEQFTLRELEAQRGFFDCIEKSPLTDEQRRAVIAYDNRVQVVAAAGSGKTSLMVARAAYAAHKGLTTPDRILLLAFNRDAAAELQERIEQRFAAAGILPTGIKSSTFHAFGLSAIGKATGAKPRIAPWIERDNGTQELSRIIEHLRDTSPRFAKHWALFRLVLAPESSDGPDAADILRKVGKQPKMDGTLRTLSGANVRSGGELAIANYLYLHQIEFEYERPYEHRTETEQHSQYLPDFYYPGLDVWHEHWALDRNGDPPTKDGRPARGWAGYESGMHWKRDLHARMRTTLIETTWDEVVNGDGLNQLIERLESYGAVPRWDPNRAPEELAPTRHEDLVRLIRTFMAHVKANSLTPEAIEGLLAGDRAKLAGRRTSVFLDLFWQIYDEWNRRLSEGNYVDFDDMLLLAAEHVESGAVSFDYDLILVDEFQDTSRTRARLAAALAKPPGRHVLTVGDDWQAINRFAGADISVMTGFTDWFGAGLEMNLSTTFRCTQEICDISSTFVSKNPAQIDKEVRSATTATGQGHGAPVKLVVVPSGTVPDAISRHLKALDEHVAGPISVFILGRYHFDRDRLTRWSFKNLDVSFKTVHSSKGLEADHVVVPNLEGGLWGFPTGIGDDPLLALAMPNPDYYPHAEERRLFYVALTRARKEVTLFTTAANESRFAIELAVGGLVDVVDEHGRPVSLHPCPDCNTGRLVVRTGPYGRFYGCSAYPECESTAQISDSGMPLVYPPCPICEVGRLKRRDGPYGAFLGCSNYPACTHKVSI